MLVVFNKLDLAAAREAWPAFRAAVDAAGIAVVAISATTARGSTSFCTASPTCCPTLEGLAEPPDPAGRRRPPHRGGGDGFTLEREDGRRSASAASGSSGSPTRRTSTTRSPPSGSSATCAGPASTPRCARPGSRPGDQVRIGGVRAGVGADRGTTSDVGPAVAPAGAGSRHRAVRGHVRPDPPRPPRDRRGGARGARAGVGAVRPGRRAAVQDRPGRDAGASTGWRWSSPRSPATRRFQLSRIELDRPGPSYTVDTSASRPLATAPSRRPSSCRPRPSGSCRPGTSRSASSLRARVAVVPREGYPAPTRRGFAAPSPAARTGSCTSTAPHLGLSRPAIRASVGRRPLRPLSRPRRRRGVHRPTMHLSTRDPMEDRRLVTARP